MLLSFIITALIFLLILKSGANLKIILETSPFAF